MTSPDPCSPAYVPDLTLAEFLKQRLDEVEHVARLAFGPEWTTTAAGEVVTRWDQSHNELVRTGRDPETDEPRYEVETEWKPSLIATVPTAWNLDHIARHDPARVLRDVAAKRKLVELHKPVPDPAWWRTRLVCGTCAEVSYDETADGEGTVDACHVAAPCASLRLLAEPFADHPDYRSEWRPGA